MEFLREDRSCGALEEDGAVNARVGDVEAPVELRTVLRVRKEAHARALDVVVVPPSVRAHLGQRDDAFRSANQWIEGVALVVVVGDRQTGGQAEKAHQHQGEGRLPGGRKGHGDEGEKGVFEGDDGGLEGGDGGIGRW